LYLLLSGPCQDTAGWWKTLQPGESFESAPAAVVFSDRGFDGTLAEMTKYRRAIRRKNPYNEKLAVIFNDYMNCLGGDPTTEKLFPLIDAAADAGCEYFCIDCGWFSFGLDCGDKIYLAVWRMDDEKDTFAIPLDGVTIKNAECIYPAGLDVQYSFHGNVLTAGMKKRTARLFKIQK